MRRIGILLAAVLLLGLCACAGRASDAKSPDVSVTPETVAVTEAPEVDRYVVATLYSGLDYFEDYKRAIAIAEEELHVSAELVGPDDYDLQEMIDVLETAIDDNVTGIILVGWEDALIPLIDKANEKGIFVCTVCQDLDTSSRALYISQDNYTAGQMAAARMVRELDGAGTVAIMRSYSITNVTERVRGFTEYLETCPGIKVVADIDHKSDAEIAGHKAMQLLQQHPKLSGILCADGISGPAVVNAVRRAGVKGICIVAYDREPVVLNAVADGTVSATIVAGTPLEVYLGIMEGQRRKYSSLTVSYDDAAAGVKLGISSIDAGCFLVDQSNVQYFIRK